MALWGTINVNSIPIAEWSARRLDDLIGVHDVHTYLCEYHHHPTGHRVTAVVEHRYSDGAAALTALVMRLAEGGWD